MGSNIAEKGIIKNTSAYENGTFKNKYGFDQDYPEFLERLYKKYISLVIKYPKVGPVFAFSQELLNDISNFNDFVLSYSKLYFYLNLHQSYFFTSYLEAWSKFNEKNDILGINSNEKYENCKKLMIDTFEETFASLLNSPNFLDNYSKLSDANISISKIYQLQFDKFLKSLNYPTKEDIDTILEEMTFFRKQIFNINQSMERKIEYDANKPD